MREIKFRAWDNRKGEGIMSNFATAQMLSTGRSGFEIQVLDGCVLMQYTGLKDKNGVEIYEGDIVEWTLNPMGAEPEKNRAEMKRLQHGLYVPHINSTSEVIGNIYENPELLQDDTSRS